MLVQKPVEQNQQVLLDKRQTWLLNKDMALPRDIGMIWSTFWTKHNNYVYNMEWLFVAWSQHWNSLTTGVISLSNKETVKLLHTVKSSKLWLLQNYLGRFNSIKRWLHWLITSICINCNRLCRCCSRVISCKRKQSTVQGR